MTGAKHRAEFTDRLSHLATAPRRSVRRRSVAGVVFGALLALLALAGVGPILALGEYPGLVGVVFLLLVGGLLVWSGVRHLRALPAGPDDTEIRLRPAYAFETDGATIDFPAALLVAADSWPLAGTTATVTRVRGADALRLTRADRPARTFSARVLRESPAEVLATVEALRTPNARRPAAD